MDNAIFLYIINFKWTQKSSVILFKTDIYVPKLQCFGNAEPQMFLDEWKSNLTFVFLSSLNTENISPMKPSSIIWYIAWVWTSARQMSRWWLSERYGVLFCEVNSLRPSDTIWRHRSILTLAQIMACCLTAPSHYLNQCWLITSGVKWCSSEGNFIWIAE